MHTEDVVLIGFVDGRLEPGGARHRWDAWHQSMALAERENARVTRLEMLHTRGMGALSEQIRADLATVAPEVKVVLTPIDLADESELREVQDALREWTRRYPFNPQREQYWTPLCSDLEAAQLGLCLLLESPVIRGVMLQNTSGGTTAVGANLTRMGANGTMEQTPRRSSWSSGLTQVQTIGGGAFVTRTARFAAMIEQIERVAMRSRAPVLLIGPTGVGKSLLARRMYDLKRVNAQLDGLFVEVNCATLRGDGTASALFGHKRGSFTGAASDRSGLLLTANRGLLFLDEIGDLNAEAQTMLLKAIEEKRFLPFGADTEVASDFQLVAGTNRDLHADVAAGRFRDDLFARINLWTYELPGLARRPDDIEPNVDRLLGQQARDGARAARFEPTARTRYLEFARSEAALWNGNFRDLNASVTRLATLADALPISDDLVQDEIERLRRLWRGANGGRDLTQVESLLGTERFTGLDLFEQVQLDAVLKVCRRSTTMSDAGRRLFQVTRRQRSVVNDADRLRKYLHRYGLTWQLVRTTEPMA
jgi:transcriptional regulatory protein RtcR